MNWQSKGASHHGINSPEQHFFDLTAENALSNTQMNLQKTLTQLSTGLKINSGIG